MTGVTFDQTYPYNDVTFAGASRQPRSASTTGFHAGADVAFYFSNWVGVGGMVRFSRGSVDLDSQDGGSVAIDNWRCTDIRRPASPFLTPHLHGVDLGDGGLGHAQLKRTASLLALARAWLRDEHVLAPRPTPCCAARWGLPDTSPRPADGPHGGASIGADAHPSRCAGRRRRRPAALAPAPASKASSSNPSVGGMKRLLARLELIALRAKVRRWRSVAACCSSTWSTRCGVR